MRYLRILFFVGILFPAKVAEAQNECLGKLVEAKKLYESGKFEQVISMLEPCVGKRTGKDLRFEAHRYLAIVYQMLGDEDKSKIHITSMLKLSPSYQKFPALDPLAFSKLLNQYQVTPLWNAGLSLTVFQNWVQLRKSFAVSTSEQTYRGNTGIQMGGFMEYKLGKNWVIRTDLSHYRPEIEQVILLPQNWKQTVIETQKYWVFIPSIQYDKPLKKGISVYAGAGFGASWLFSSNIYLQKSQNDFNVDFKATKDVLDERKRISGMASLRLGLNYEMRNGVFCIESNYRYATSVTVKSDMRMSDLGFAISNEYVSDDVALRNILFTLGYKRPISYKITAK